MVSQRLTIPILLAAICGGVLVCAAADLRLGSSNGVLLLRNGSVLRGVIALQGDHYVVSFGNSGRARVAASNVERVCDDLEQAYRYKLSRLDGSLASRTGLARWCIQQNLLARAADQLLTAETQHGNSPQLETLHQQLLLAARPSERARPDASAQSSLNSSRERAELLKDLTPRMIEQFTAEVQPLLLNRCASSGCHSVRSGTSLVLIRPPTSHSLTRRLTEQNLTSTLLQLDRERPLESPLLRNARLAHGGASTAVITDRDVKQFQLLADWVHSVRAATRTSKPTTIVEPNDVLLQAPAATRRDIPKAAESELPPAVPANENDYQPLDPFDPEVFNRRYHSAD
ncbi:MAG: hypothetical protein CMJ64_28500 [Planctomycetaceae bacterium]|nr:hypothetical protein [Planctomycetaceae bacterium]